MTSNFHERSIYMTCVIGLVLALHLTDFAHGINIDFDDSRDGFFLKSLYHKFKQYGSNIVKESLILTHPAEVYKLRASYGPFEMYQSVPNKVLSNVLHFGEDIWDKSESRMHRQVVHNMDVSAHLVGQEDGFVRHTNPVVQLLIHASPLVRRQSQHIIYSYYGYSQRWCARLFLAKGGEQYTAACVLEGGTNACVVGMHLPEHWWDTEEKVLETLGNKSFTARQEVLVFYDISGVEQNQECASVSNTIVPAQDAQSTTQKKFITSLKLVHDDSMKSMDHRSGDLIFRVPTTDMAPGVKFEVPVLLGADSPLKKFVAKVEVRGRLSIEGASRGLNSQWNVFFEPGDSEGIATVSAFLKEDVGSQHTDSLEEVMRWHFLVLPVGDGSTTARASWEVDYDRNLSDADAMFSGRMSFSAKFNILPHTSAQIIPVRKERSLLNTAILSGEQVVHQLNIFSVAQDHTFRDVTKDSHCRSTDPTVVKVSPSCDQIYLDGSETKGSHNVTISVRVGDNMAVFSIRVWVPEPPLDVQLSDPRLSQVRRWRVRTDPSSSQQGSGLTPTSATNNTQTTEVQSCPLKYQQSRLEVYARFSISTPGQGTDYYRSKKTMLRVTSMVLPRMRTANPRVAKMQGQTVQGVSAGKTQVQVISPTGTVLGSREIRVARDKIDIERLMVRVISGMGLHIEELQDLPGALLATVYLQDQLVAKQQEAVLDIALEFKDGTVLPLSSIDPNEYDLSVTSADNNIVEIMNTVSAEPSIPPSIKAIGNGKGEIIKVTMREKNSCDRKKPKVLDAEYVHAQVDFAKDIDFYNKVQSDGYFITNRDHKTQQKHYKSKEEYFKHLKEQQQQDHNRLMSSAYGDKFSKADPKVHPLDPKHDTFTLPEEKLDTEDLDMTEEPPKSEAMKQMVSTKAKHPTPLEVAMYVLVAVFVFAILVFTANCAVFMVRHQRKCKPYQSVSSSHSKNLMMSSSSSHTSGKLKSGGSVSQAPDWVWIGRATLERQGAGNAGLDHPLMAEEDFNGNQMVLPHSASRSLSVKSASRKGGGDNMSRSSSSSGHPATSASSHRSGCGSNRNSMVSTYQGSECSIRITANPLLQQEAEAEAAARACDELGGMGYNEAEWDYEAMGMTYEQLMDYFDNLKESSA